MRYFILEKGRRPFKAGTKRRYGNYIQIRTEAGWREYPIDDAIADRDVERVTEPGSSYPHQSHPPKRMHPTGQKRKLHAFAAESTKTPSSKRSYKKKPKVKKKAKLK